MCHLFVHQKLKINFVIVAWRVVWVLLNVMLNDFHAVSSHVFWINYSLYFMYSSSLSLWKLCATLRVLFDVTLCPWRQREICCSGKCRLSWRAFKFYGGVICAFPASLSALIFMSS
jgi:hypothetical protein